MRSTNQDLWRPVRALGCIESEQRRAYHTLTHIPFRVCWQNQSHYSHRSKLNFLPGVARENEKKAEEKALERDETSMSPLAGGAINFKSRTRETFFALSSAELLKSCQGEKRRRCHPFPFSAPHSLIHYSPLFPAASSSLDYALITTAQTHLWLKWVFHVNLRAAAGAMIRRLSRTLSRSYPPAARYTHSARCTATCSARQSSKVRRRAAQAPPSHPSLAIIPCEHPASLHAANAAPNFIERLTRS